MTELYNVPDNSLVRILNNGTLVPPGALPIMQNDVLLFKHADGMYTYCLDCNNNIVHPAAWVDVEVLDSEEI